MSFNLKSGNTTSFKQMGSSPVKQAVGGGAGEAVAHWKKYNNQARTSMNIDLSKMSKKAQLQKLATEVKKPTSTLGRVTKALKNTSKQLAKPGLKIAKQIGKRFLGPVGVALTAYDVAKTLPKAAKATDKALKKEAKTGNTVGKPKY